MIDYSEVISQIEDVHCGACKHGLAIRALTQLVETLPIPVKPEQTLPETKKGVKVHKRPSKSVKGWAEKVCHACDVSKPVTAFPNNKACKDGHTGTCKACTVARAKKTRASARARKQAKAANVLDEIEADTKKLHDFRCVICHANFPSQAKLADHNQGRHGD